MEPLVLLDTNVIIARCLDPGMDPKGRLAEGVLTTLSDESLVPYITESVRREFEVKMHHRVGQILDILRRFSLEPPPAPNREQSSLQAMENLFARLRSDAPDSASALQVLENRLVKTVGSWVAVTKESWGGLLGSVAVETTGLLAEIQKRFDTSGIMVIRTPSKVELERFRPFVPRKDLEHVALASSLARQRTCKVIFVTLESPLHAVRDQIAAADPDLVVTTPAYLRNQIERLRALPA